MTERSGDRPPVQSQQVDALFVVPPQHPFPEEGDHLMIPAHALELPRNSDAVNADMDIVEGIWRPEQPLGDEKAGRIQVERVLTAPGTVLIITPEGREAAPAIFNFLRWQTFKQRGGDTARIPSRITQTPSSLLSTPTARVSQASVAQHTEIPGKKMTIIEKQPTAPFNKIVPVWMALEAIFTREMEQATKGTLRIPRLYAAMGNRENTLQVFFLEYIPKSMPLIRMKEDLLRNRGRGKYSQEITKLIEDTYETEIFFLTANLELYGPPEAKECLDLFKKLREGEKPQVPNVLVSPPDPEEILKGDFRMYLLDSLLG